MTRRHAGHRVHVHVLLPGEAPGYYHAEEAQEGFVVLSGECIAIVEGEERRMRRWDYLHSPPRTEHITVGAGDEPCAILMFGSPDSRRKVEWIAKAGTQRHTGMCRSRCVCARRNPSGVSHRLASPA